MVITAKHDGSPRRVVDYQQINNLAPRQTHHTPSAWQIVSSIPAGKVKSVVDCFHGYHSVPIHPADRHLTTFLTQWGRFRYRTSPQGFLSAGDGYSQRMDKIIGDFKDYKKCVDDTIIYDDSIEDNFFRVCEFLEKCNKGGCIFNPQKFQFGDKEVDFLGFRVKISDPPTSCNTANFTLSLAVSFPVAMKKLFICSIYRSNLTSNFSGFFLFPLKSPGLINASKLVAISTVKWTLTYTTSSLPKLRRHVLKRVTTLKGPLYI